MSVEQDDSYPEFKQNERCPMYTCNGRMKKHKEPKDIAGGDERGFYFECNKCHWEDRCPQEPVICVKCRKPIPDKDIPEESKRKVAIQYYWHLPQCPQVK